jgi:hypothetical protein
MASMVQNSLTLPVDTHGSRRSGKKAKKGKKKKKKTKRVSHEAAQIVTTARRQKGPGGYNRPPRGWRTSRPSLPEAPKHPPPQAASEPRTPLAPATQCTRHHITQNIHTFALFEPNARGRGESFPTLCSVDTSAARGAVARACVRVSARHVAQKRPNLPKFAQSLVPVVATGGATTWCMGVAKKSRFLGSHVCRQGMAVTSTE